ncbi:hypothetical protein V1292_005440 [Bradyrhizobium sp. AZCC 1719]|uniref:hypothetical protein n=1 Tax=Bradyrhizobium sp. AZCC 1719 TaxID=3117028 RepID=UPI002FF12B25
MFEKLRLNWKIRQLQRLKNQYIGVTYEALREVAHETGEIPDKEVIREEILNTVKLNREMDERIAILESDYWLDQAQRYLLPTPNDQAYIRSKLDKRFSYFDEETLAALRSAVRKEQKERSENFRTWATLAIGIIGALIGLAAMLKK